MYRPARFVSRVQVVTSHDVNIEQLSQKEIVPDDALGVGETPPGPATT